MTDSQTWIDDCQSIAALFERTADRHPDQKAIEFSTSRLSYRDLERRANRVANWLRQQGVVANSIVGICIPRSIECIVAVLATLKAGACYLPLDPHYPLDRLAFMVEDSQALLVLGAKSEQQHAQAFGVSWFDIEQIERDFDGSDTRPSPATTPLHLAYAIYTSGSTGHPKGVAMPHGPLLNLMKWQCRASRAGVGDKTLQFAPLSFDVSFQEIFSTFATAGTLVLVNDDLRLDTPKLLHLINNANISRVFLPFVALQSMAEVAASHQLVPQCLREVITAGEALRVDRYMVSFFQSLPHCTLHNHYGPSETHVVTEHVLRGAPSEWPPLPPIGHPIDSAILLLKNEDGSLRADGQGELYVGGPVLASGYLHRQELTNQRFIIDASTGLRLYKTGDLARQLPDGSYEFLGRADDQVKIRGHRVELGEIEVVLAKLPLVSQVAVVAKEDDRGRKHLVAYLTSTDKHHVGTQELRAFCHDHLPDYMIPSNFLWLDSMPKTPSGKIDRRALPEPPTTRRQLDDAFVPPREGAEKHVAELWGRLLGLDTVGATDNFFDLGGNSILAVQMLSMLRADKGWDLSIGQIFANPTVRSLVHSVEHTPVTLPPVSHLPQGDYARDPIAIIGMAACVPGARNLHELWTMLCEGRESISFFRPEELDPSISPELRSNKNYVPARGIIPDAEYFDAAFFAIPPREAELMDPQQRIFLQVAWAALEDAACVPSRSPGRIGVYAGTGNNSYFATHVLPNPDAIEKVGTFQTMVANEKDYVATRLAYKLGLTGPAMAIHSACSTSLVAIVEACHGLWAGRCDVAVAGGASITAPIRSGYLYAEGGMLSPDGHCRPFDAAAQGTTFGDGAGVVVLKRLKDALTDNDRIYAVIGGAATNNDGADKMSFTAPSVSGQAAVIAAAQQMAGYDPRSISYVETHGTATELGDPIEVEALTNAFRRATNDRAFCAIGSIKSNIGHLTAAAGVAGLIKTSLALHHNKLPPTLHYRAPNPKIDFNASPFYVQAKLEDWTAATGKRRAGVSSFGVGGTNAHIVLEEAPGQASSQPEERPQHLLLLSAQTQDALNQSTEAISSVLASQDKLPMEDLCFTMAKGRSPMKHRRVAVASSHAEMIRALKGELPARRYDRLFAGNAPSLAFLFPGQGAQYPGMGQALYDTEESFKADFDRCAEIVKDCIGQDLRQVLFVQPHAYEQAASRLKATELTQPALFSIGYCTARLFQSWGVKPNAMAGHSVGELAAACLAGVFSLEDALRLVTRRGQLMQSMPSGSMLSVRAPVHQLESRLGPRMAIASINSPHLCVVSGPSEDVARLQSQLEAQDILCKPLHTSHAFHSPMMDDILGPFGELVRSVTLSAPSIPIVSTATGTWLTNAEATDPEYWTRHLRSTVRFSDAVAVLLEDADRCLLELGPRSTLCTLARQQMRDTKRQLAIASLGDDPSMTATWASIFASLGQYWAAGGAIDWNQLHRADRRKIVSLPSYPFARKRTWITPPMSQAHHLTHTLSDTRGTDTMSLNAHVANTPSRHQHLVSSLKDLFQDTSGLELAEAPSDATFLELGLDSLFLTQASIALQKKFGVQVSFRNLVEDLSTLDALSRYLDEKLPAEALPVAQPATPQQPTLLQAPAPVQSPSAPCLPFAPVATMGAVDGSVQQLVAQQLAIMARQLELLGGQPVATPSLAPQPTPPAQRETTSSPRASQAAASSLPEEGSADLKKPFGAIARIQTSADKATSESQKRALDAFMSLYISQTKQSKDLTQKDRAYLADPRVVTGFRPPIKEIIYPIVVERSRGSKVWDIDGNEYVDLLCGFGSNFFGHSPAFLVDVMRKQLDEGIEIGPQHRLAGEVAKLVCELTGLDRAGFCNTGSEAVLGAMRMARTITGRSTIALFSGSYHGIFDEVLVRGTRKLRTVPAAPGVMPEAVGNVLVLDYGTPESLEILRSRANELAAVLIEPVQSRRTDFRPRDFLHEVRKLTRQSGSAMIFDEVISGFRYHPGGAQAFYGIDADIATYGKVIGGGLPIGIIAGKRAFMDALDGGSWQYGDDSVPTVGVTYFAGTFVRHPLALAAAKAACLYLKEHGPKLQQDLNERTDSFVKQVTELFSSAQVPFKIANFGSVFKITYPEDLPNGDLFFAWMRSKGVYIWDHFPSFLTLAHTNEDVDRVINAIRATLSEMQHGALLPGNPIAPKPASDNQPPVPGARLGRDAEGKPAWFVPDPNRPGKFLQVKGAQ